ELARESPPAALDWIASRDGLERADAIETVAREFALSDPVGGLEHIAQLRGSLATQLRDALLEQWALVDPAALWAYVASIESTRELITLCGERPRWVQTLAAVAPELALESAPSMSGRAGVDLQQLAIRELAKTEPARAAAIAAGTA